MSDTGAETGHRMPPSHHSPGHEHPGGQVCLAMLVMAALLVLTAVLVGRREGSVASSDPAGREVDAGDQKALAWIQEIVSRDLERFGRRERLEVTWQPPDAPNSA